MFQFQALELLHGVWFLGFSFNYFKIGGKLDAEKNEKDYH